MKMNNIFMLLILMVFTFNLVSATDPIPNLQAVQQNSNVVIPQVSDNSTFCNLTSVRYPINSTENQFNLIMTKNNDFYTRTLNASFTHIAGTYTVCTRCDPNGIVKTRCFNYEVTPSGLTGLSSFYFLAIILSFGLVAFGIWRADISFTILGTFGLYSMGMFILFNGLDSTKNSLTNAIAIITLGIAAYVSVRSALEYITD